MVDIDGGSLTKVRQPDDPLFLPGSLKYAGLGGLGALAAPTPLVVWGTQDLPPEEAAPLSAAYKVAKGSLHIEPARATSDELIKSLK